GPVARRRRRRKSKEEHVSERTSESRLIINELEKIAAPRKIFKSNIPTKDYVIYNAIHPRNSMNNTPPSDLRTSLSDSNFSEAVTTTTDIEAHRASSTVSVKRIKRNTIEQLNNTEKLNETKNIHIKSENHTDNGENTRITRRSTVTVVRVPKLAEEKQNNLITLQQNSSNTLLAKPSKFDQVKVIKISRSQSTFNQRTRAISLGNVITINSNKSFIEMRSMADLAKTASLAPNINAHQGSRVTVTKLPRKSTIC
ncbi:unnamed protein product, partial [Rotaria sp. Silwood1]